MKMVRKTSGKLSPFRSTDSNCTVSDETVGLFGMSGLNNPIENPLYSPMVIVTRL